MIEDNIQVSSELEAERKVWDEGGASQPASSCIHRQAGEGYMYKCCANIRIHWSIVTRV